MDKLSCPPHNDARIYYDASRIMDQPTTTKNEIGGLITSHSTSYNEYRANYGPSQGNRNI